MTDSTSSHNNHSGEPEKQPVVAQSSRWLYRSQKARKLWAVALWLIVWQVASIGIGQEILLVSPVRVLLRLGELALTQPFWQSIMFSFGRIVSGFLLAVVVGIVFATLAYISKRFEEFLAPLMSVIKTTPVASFIILALIWISSRNLSVFISFLMVLPIMYTNILGGLRSSDGKLLEVAHVFRVPFRRQIQYIYVSQVMPFFRSACLTGLGLGWKAGIAAEVIGIPSGSIGEKLYQAKIYLNTPDLFAWTVVIILLSLLFEHLFMKCLNYAVKRLERM